MTDHDRARDIAAAAIDVALSPAERSFLDAHVADCEPCRLFAESLGADAAAMAALPELPLPGGLRSRVLDPDAAVRPARGAAIEPSRRTPPHSLFPGVPAAYRPAALVAAVVAISLVAGTLVWQLRPSVPDVAVVPTPSAAPDPSASPGGTPPPVDRVVVARLEPTGAANGVVDLDASFRLTSVDGTPPAEIAERLVVEPRVVFEITTEAGGSAVRLTPTEPLASGAVYRFSLAGESGQLLDSWAFQTRQGVRVVETLPSDRSTDVPLESGIEIVFDQDGVTNAAEHVTIEPAVEGRFEQHGRVLAFVPEALVPATSYTVTVSSGITVVGTDEVGSQAMSFRFETAATASPGGRIVLQDDLLDAATADRATVGLWIMPESDEFESPETLPVEVFRLPTIDAAIDAFRANRAWAWARHGSAGLTPVDGLTRVLAADVPLQEHQSGSWLALPDVLPAGWYLVQIANPSSARPLQAVLQVTDVAAYLAVSESRTLVWANDLESDDPIAGATVAFDSATLGRTGTDGLLLADTPADLADRIGPRCQADCEPVITIATADGRAALVPAGGVVNRGDFFGGSFSFGGEANPRYWTVFSSDRTLFRQTDTINAWGVLRERDSGEVPDAVTIRLAPLTDTRAEAPAVTSIDLEPRSTGAFHGSLTLADLPLGHYVLELVVDGDVVTAREIQVGEILKPAYRIEAQTGRRVYIVGDRIRVTVRASFFDGTPVPAVPIRLNGYLETDVTTDASGTAVIPTVATPHEDNNGEPDYQTLYATPGRPEEGEIAGASRDFLVFPSSRTIDSTAEISGGRVRVSGGVHLVDQERLEREIGDGGSIWDLDPRGAPVGGARVSVRFVERILVRGEARQEYDFLQKKVVTTYDHFIEERVAGTTEVVTDAAGGFSASIPADAEHDYDVYLSVRDTDGNIARRQTYASHVAIADEALTFPDLQTTDPGLSADHAYTVGESIDLTFRAPEADETGRSYLFFEAQRGIRSATAQPAPRYVTTFDAAAAPNMDIHAVRFNGAGYDAGSTYLAQFRRAERSLDIDLSAASEPHAPGDDVTVNVLVRDATGTPVAATVLLRAIDEKLYSIGGAGETDALGSLYSYVSGGILVSYHTHRPPRGETGGGDTTGGGGDDRSDFRDSLLFTAIDTGADGRGSVSFALADDLTSWRVSASAITSDLEAGDATLQIPVGLPFFVDATIAPEYLAADRPTIVVRTFGTALEAGDDVSISVEAPSLGLSSGPLPGKAFGAVEVPLPALRPGRHEITVRASTGAGASAMSDGVTRTFLVVESRLTRAATAYAELERSSAIEGGTGLTTVVVSDAGAGRHMPLLLELAGATSARLDSSLAAALAADLLIERFGLPPETVPAPGFAADRYQTPNGGLALLPYATSSVELSALAAFAGGERFDAARLEAYLTATSGSSEETRERRIIALAGLAALGAPVLPEIRAAAADPELTIRERLFIGIGAARIGDVETGRRIADDLIAAAGEQVGERIRLRVGESASDITTASALMAILTAAVDDRRATGFWAYVEANPTTEAVVDLHATAYITASLEWLDAEPASFAWTLAGKRTVVELEPGRAHSFFLAPSQLADLRIEPVEGAIGVATSWREPVAAAAFEPDPDIAIERSVTPAGRIGSDDLVRVDLVVTFGEQAAQECHHVTDLVPSGLVPVGNVAAWIDPNEEGPAFDTGLPYAQGRIVEFCAAPTPTDRAIELRYYARVITPGTYVWQPAVVDSPTDPSRAALTPATEIEIR